jgi:hypothetical protein
MVRRLESLKRASSSLDAPPRNQQKAPAAASSSAPQLKSNHQGAPRTMASKRTRGEAQQDFDDYMPNMDDGYEEQSRPTADYVRPWAAYRNERNKENRPTAKPNTKPSMLDPQPGAHRVAWDSQDNVAGPSTNKRQHQATTEDEEEGEEEQEEPEEEREEEEEEEESEDGGFEQDRRVPDPSRRAPASIKRRQSPVQDSPSPPKRQHVEHLVGRVVARRRQQRAGTTASQVSARPESINGDEDVEDHPPPTATQVAARARLVGIQSRINKEPQRRTPWSPIDEQRLIDGIEEFGCSWSLISKNIDFDFPRDQVALKDKARNLKVNYLK